MIFDYKEVPPCPSCGSKITGHYVAPLLIAPDDRDYVMREKLKRGEIVRICNHIPEKNCFCEACGFTWHAYLQDHILFRKDMEAQVELRHTEERYRLYCEKHPKEKRLWVLRLLKRGRRDGKRN